jgi:hypothetical protein
MFTGPPFRQAADWKGRPPRPFLEGYFRRLAGVVVWSRRVQLGPTAWRTHDPA